MTRTLYALGALLVLLVLSLAGGRWYLHTAEPDYDRDATLAGLTEPVEVWRDSLGVPHIWARNEADLFRAIGFVHAQDRLWQMELFRRVADGRLAEVLGEPALDSDRFLRTVGMGRAAAATEATLDAPTRALLQAYADGVNAWISGHSGALPPEFVALRFKPEPWTVRNSLAIGKIMAWDLAQWELGLDLQYAVDRVGAEKARDLFPRYPADGLNILGSDAQWSPSGIAPRGPAGPPAPTAGAPLPRVPALALELLDAASTARASNAWVIGGSRTRSGKPILANDMHLALRAPAIWYLAALHGGEFSVTGMTIPGAPVVVAGHNQHVAWGFTNAGVDDTDFFIERLSPDSARYLSPAGWEPLTVREETIQVKGRDPVVERVRTTRHGPILSGVEPRADGRVLAMRWTALDPSTEFRALAGMNRSRDAAEFMQALRAFNNPHQNVVFADDAGTIGYWMAGRVPIRRGGDGVLPVLGWTGEGDWIGELEWDSHPHVVNPTDGFVVTANNRQIGPEYPYYLTSDWTEPYRATRIRELVEDGKALTADDVAGQQMDVRDEQAGRYLPHARRAAEAVGDSTAIRLLAEWDGSTTIDSRAAPLYYAWLEALSRRVSSDEYRGRRVYFPRAALERILDAGDGAWVDDVSTPERETLAALSVAAMRDALSQVGGRSWGDVHHTIIEHSLGSARVLDRTLGLNIGPFSSPGSPNTVNVASFGGAPPFVTTHGASQRHVVDLSDPDGAGGFILPTGQSGLPFSTHYRDQNARWRTGRLWAIPLDRDRAAARTVHRMKLTGDGATDARE
jgi:penicillin amidase